jgi:ferritin
MLKKTTDGFANFSKADSGSIHAMKIYNFLIDRGGKALKKLATRPTPNR